MNIVLWVLQGLLAAAFLAAGLTKLTQPRTKLAASGMGYAEDFSDGTIKAIGTLEVLAAIGLLLPAITGVAPVLTALAAAGLVALMIGAAITHLRRGEAPMTGINVALLAVAAVIVWGRFGPYAL